MEESCFAGQGGLTAGLWPARPSAWLLRNSQVAWIDKTTGFYVGQGSLCYAQYRNGVDCSCYWLPAERKEEAVIHETVNSQLAALVKGFALSLPASWPTVYFFMSCHYISHL